MKSISVVFGLLGLLAFEASAACNSGQTSPCNGKLEYVMATPTGTVITRVRNGANAVISNVLTLDAAFVGSHRFDLIYTGLLNAIAREAKIYIEFDGSNRITALSVYSPEFPIENP